MKSSLVFLFASLVWGAFTSDAQSSPSNAIVAWGKLAVGLKVGISCDTKATDSRKLPKLFFYVSNDGSREIQGIIQSGAECIVTVNGQHYAQESHGGKTSWMPPGRNYGPIAIDIERLRKVPELRTWPVIDPSAPPPELLQGTNKISLHYRFDNKLVASGEIQIVAK